MSKLSKSCYLSTCYETNFWSEGYVYQKVYCDDELVGLITSKKRVVSNKILPFYRNYEIEIGEETIILPHKKFMRRNKKYLSAHDKFIYKTQN